MIRLHHAVGLAILAFELAHLVRRRSHATRDQSADRASLRLVWCACLVGIASATYLRASSTNGHFELGPVGTAIALTLVVLGFALRIWAVVTLGRYFTVDVAIREGHQLVHHGPFRCVRHPSYSGLIVIFAGWALTFETTWSIPALLLPLVLTLLYRIHVEEAALSAAFGAEYSSYCAHRARLIPGLH